jgi:hypothetical protein
MPANHTSPDAFDLTRERICRDFDSRAIRTRDRIVFWQGYVSALAQARSLSSSEATSLHRLILLEGEKNPEVHPWYPAKRKPADERRVLALFQDGERVFMREAYRSGGAWRGAEDNQRIELPALYWRVLPELPEGIL